MSFLIWAVITIAILYSVFKGVALCFNEDTVLGIVVLVIALSGVGFILPIALYVADRFFKRNFAHEFMVWLHSMKPSGAWKRHLPESARSKVDNFEERYKEGSWKNRLHPRVATVVTRIEDRWNANKPKS